MRKRPKVVSVVAVFLFAATLVATVVGISLLFPGTFLDRVWELNKAAYAGFKAIGRTSGLLLLIVGICTAVAGTGLLRGERWARRLAIAIFTINGLGDAVNLLITRDLLKSGIGALIAVLFLFCLLRPSVTVFFENGDQLAGTSLGSSES